MYLIQYQFTNFSVEELNLIPDFNYFVCDAIFSKLNTKINRRKIQLRLQYLLNKVNWINWDSDKYNITVSDILSAIHQSITYEKYKDNLFKIKIDDRILIPYSRTSIDRLVRFLAYGDMNQQATDMFTNLENEFNHNTLNSMWQMFTLKNDLGFTDTKIIAR